MPGTISQYQVVIAGQTITAALWNGMENNIINNGLIWAGIDDYSATDGEMQTQTDPYPSSSTSRPTSALGELLRLRYQIAQITGETYWYVDPDISIATLKSNYDTHVGHFDAHTHDGTTNNGPQIQAGGIASNAVTTAKILDSNVTTAKIADGAITSAKLGNNLIMPGLITKPSQSGFLAYKQSSSTNATGDGTEVLVGFDELYDADANFTASVFTAPLTGLYVFCATVSLKNAISASADVVILTIRTTGRDYTLRQSANFVNALSDEGSLQLVCIHNMTAGNTASVYVQASGGTKTIEIQGSASSSLLTSFSGYLLG